VTIELVTLTATSSSIANTPVVNTAAIFMIILCVLKLYQCLTAFLLNKSEKDIHAAPCQNLQATHYISTENASDLLLHLVQILLNDLTNSSGIPPKE